MHGGLSPRPMRETERRPRSSPRSGPTWHRLRLDRAAARPSVSIIVANRDSFRRLSVLTQGLFEATDYPDFELIVVDAGSTDPDTLALYERLRRRHSNFTLVSAPGVCGGAAVNRGLRLAKGGAALRLDNDIEIIEPGWLAEMVGCLGYQDAGIVGARLLHPTLGASHAEDSRLAELPVRSVASAVTGSCLLISRACLDAVGGFDETDFAVAFGDVDLCLRARAAGFRTIYTPFATLVRHDVPAQSDRAALLRAEAALIERHGAADGLDPALSPWRDRSSSARLRLEALPRAR